VCGPGWAQPFSWLPHTLSLPEGSCKELGLVLAALVSTSAVGWWAGAEPCFLLSGTVGYRCWLPHSCFWLGWGAQIPQTDADFREEALLPYEWRWTTSQCSARYNIGVQICNVQGKLQHWAHVKT